MTPARVWNAAVAAPSPASRCLTWRAACLMPGTSRCRSPGHCPARGPLVAALGLELDRGRLVVDENLAVPGHPHVFAGGDAAAVPDLARPGRVTPPTAQHAARQGRALARNVAASLGHGSDPGLPPAGDAQARPPRPGRRRLPRRHRPLAAGGVAWAGRCGPGALGGQRAPAGPRRRRTAMTSRYVLAVDQRRTAPGGRAWSSRGEAPSGGRRSPRQQIRKYFAKICPNFRTK